MLFFENAHAHADADEAGYADFGNPNPVNESFHYCVLSAPFRLVSRAQGCQDGQDGHVEEKLVGVLVTRQI